MFEKMSRLRRRNIRTAVFVLAMTGLLMGSACTNGAREEQVTAQNVSLRNSPIVATKIKGEISVSAEKVCYWNDKKYSDGALICENHRRRECWTDKWVDIGNC